MRNVLVCGSLAYDYIMNFNDKFKNHILPDKIHVLSVCFTAKKLSKEFGGTAGNIGYNLKLMGLNPLIFATAGSDFSEYNFWLTKNRISTEYIKILKNKFTASAHIITDSDDNQISAFHSGAMAHNHRPLMETPKKEKIDLAICAPDCSRGMILHIKELKNLKIPYVFDPGQGIIGFIKKDLKEMIRGARVLILNDYEYQILKKKTELSHDSILKLVDYLVVTLGSKGSIIYYNDKKYVIPAAKPKNNSDPTGAGDAYRAGLIFGLLNNLSPDIMGKVASLCAVYTVEKYGTQTHKYSFKQFRKRYYQNFKINLK